MPETQTFNLLNPEEAQRQYRNNIGRSIEAYSPTHLVVAEAMQNALDAITQLPNRIPEGELNVSIDFNSGEVEVEDNGVGFPEKPELLVIGGTTKNKGAMGRVGVGSKVVLFSSEKFELHSNDGRKSFQIVLNEAHRFMEEGFNLELEQPFPNSTKKTNRGTKLIYRFPKKDGKNEKLIEFLDHIKTRLRITGEEVTGFSQLVKSDDSSNAAAKLIGMYLQRFTYAGDTQAPLGGREGLGKTKINLSVKCTDRENILDSFWSSLWGEDETQTYEFDPNYLIANQTVEMQKTRKPGLFHEALGLGGQNLERTASGFNITHYIDKDQFTQLLKDANGRPSKQLRLFEEKLFPKINCITLTISRIPLLENYLPGHARRVISANGVVTDHDIDISSGQNQQYVRCVDLVLDVDAELNYGKTHLTNSHLVGLCREFVNEAFSRTINYATQRFVGTIKARPDDLPEDKFWQRDDLGWGASFPIKKVPKDENDVISIFVGLLAQQRITDVHIYGFSQQDTYDARMLLKRDSDPDDLLDSPRESFLRTVEFKLNASSIIKDFESNIKDPEDIHLLIAWDQGRISGTRFTIDPIEHSDAYLASPQQVYPGATHFITDTRTGKQMQVLLLVKKIWHRG